MKAIDRPFGRIINGTTQFVVPVFQRDYSWTEPQCEQLWNDIISIGGDSSDRGHFLGSVVYVATGDSAAGFTRWLLTSGISSGTPAERGLSERDAAPKYQIIGTEESTKAGWAGS